MPRLTDAGFVRTTQAQYNAEFINAFRSVFGDDMQTGADTIQGLIARALAAQFARLDAEVLNHINGFDPTQMIGSQLDNYAAGFQLMRKAATKTQVNITFAGVAGTALDQGIRVESENGDVFVTTSSSVIGTNGEVVIAGEAEEDGIINILSTDNDGAIIDTQTGLNTATLAVTVLGTNAERDVEFRKRIALSRDRNAIGTISGIRSRLLDINGVNHVLILENRANAAATVSGVGLPARALYTIIDYDTANTGIVGRIVEAMYLASYPGQVFSGTTTQTYTDSLPPNLTHRITFQQSIRTATTVSFELTVNDNFPSNGLTILRTAIHDFWYGRFESENFSPPEVTLGQLPRLNDLEFVIRHTPGIQTLTNLAIKQKSDDSSITSVSIITLLTLAVADISITLSTV